MAFTKYSVGQIIEVKNGESVESREVATLVDDLTYAVCKKCGLQHMISKGEKRICCGDMVGASLS